jgi:diaminohydroxyphosphoribosylaminopyrimidine deaminase/5-amino-6-(5-phosphoribosylamino)uracil reductase
MRSCEICVKPLRYCTLLNADSPFIELPTTPTHPMLVPSIPTDSPASRTEARSVETLWPHLLNLAHGPNSSTDEVLTWTAETGCLLRGVWPIAARELFELFKPLLDRHAAGAGWVVAQLGQSLDGCVATRTGESMFINGPENIVHLHRLRALSEAVMVGAGTVAADNPQLTARRVPGPNPTRVLLDPRLTLADLAPTSHVFNDGKAPTLWLCDARWGDQARRLVGAERVLAVPGLLRDDRSPDLALAVAALRARGLRRLFIEGGGVTVSRFVAQACLDRLHLAVAPVIIGDGRPGLRFAGAARLADCPRPVHSVYKMGVDQLWDLDLRACG